MPNIFTKDIQDFVMLTQHIEPEHIKPENPEQDLLDDVLLCGMVMMNYRNKVAV